jgi:hypothetical protein
LCLDELIDRYKAHLVVFENKQEYGASPRWLRLKIIFAPAASHSLDSLGKQWNGNIAI